MRAPSTKPTASFELIRGVYFRHLGRQAWHDKIESALHAVALNPGDVLGKYPHQLSAIVEMDDTVKVFSNAQHPYTRDLLAAVPELHKKWHADAGEGQAAPVNGAAGVQGNGKADVLANGSGDVSGASEMTPALARRGHARHLTRAERPPQSARTLEPPPLTRFEEDHFVATAES